MRLARTLVIGLPIMRHGSVLLFCPPVHLAAVSSYADQREVSVTHGADPCYGAKHPSVTSSADIVHIREKFVAHMLTYCDPHIS